MRMDQHTYMIIHCLCPLCQGQAPTSSCWQTLALTVEEGTQSRNRARNKNNRPCTCARASRPAEERKNIFSSWRGAQRKLMSAKDRSQHTKLRRHNTKNAQLIMKDVVVTTAADPSEYSIYIYIGSSSRAKNARSKMRLGDDMKHGCDYNRHRIVFMAFRFDRIIMRRAH